MTPSRTRCSSWSLTKTFDKEPAITRNSRRVAAVLILTLSQIGAAAPAFAHGGGEAAADLPAADTVARAVALVAAALLAGVALIRPMAGRPTESARRLLGTAAAAGVVAALAGAVGTLDGPRYLLLVPLLILAAATASFGPAGLAVLAGSVSTVWLCWSAITDSLGEAALMLGHVGVAVVWAGAVFASATAEPGARAPLVRRLSPVALGAGVLAAVTGVLSARNYDVTLEGITITDFGSVVVLKVVLLIAAGVLGLGVRYLLRARRRPGPRRGGVLARLELGVLIAAIVAGAVLTSLPPPGPPPVAGSPLVRALEIDEAMTGLVIAPQRPGTNLVHLMTDRLTDVVVDGRRYRAEARPGMQGMWAEVHLPPGRSLLELRQGRQVAAQIVDTGTGPQQATLAGPDGAECASAALGAGLAGSKAPLAACPSDALAPADATALRALVGSLGSRGVKRLTLITDTSPRGAAAEREVRAAARTAGIAVAEGLPADGKPEALLAVAGWQISELRLAQYNNTGTPPLYGTYLAPWLVQAAMVAATGGSPLTVLPFDPTGPDARAYLAALREVGPSESASASGYLAYLAALGRPLPPHDLLLYAATVSFEVMPMGGDEGDPGAMAHGGIDLTWFAGGALTPVSRPLTAVG